jgi:hypothetical protein
MFNLSVMFRNARVLLMAASLALPGWASAAEIKWLPEQGKDSYSVMVPRIDIDELVDEMVALKGTLKHDEQVLARKVEEKRMSGNDKVIAFLMPGGMLYAAYKKSAHAAAVKERERVAERLKETTTDIVTLTAMNSHIMVAQR